MRPGRQNCRLSGSSTARKSCNWARKGTTISGVKGIIRITALLLRNCVDTGKLLCFEAFSYLQSKNSFQKYVF